MSKKVVVILGLLVGIFSIQAQDVELVSPHNNMVIEDSVVDFVWNTNTIYSSYNIQVADDSLFSTIFIDSANILTGNINLNIGNNKTRYWKIKASKVLGGVDSTNVYSFSTISFSQLSSLYFRFVADSGVVHTNDTVSLWNDIGPNTLNIAQALSTKQPLLMPKSVKSKWSFFN